MEGVFFTKSKNSGFGWAPAIQSSLGIDKWLYTFFINHNIPSKLEPYHSEPVINIRSGCGTWFWVSQEAKYVFFWGIHTGITVIFQMEYGIIGINAFCPFLSEQLDDWLD